MKKITQAASEIHSMPELWGLGEAQTIHILEGNLKWCMTLPRKAFPASRLGAEIPAGGVDDSPFEDQG